MWSSQITGEHQICASFLGLCFSDLPATAFDLPHRKVKQLKVEDPNEVNEFMRILFYSIFLLIQHKWKHCLTTFRIDLRDFVFQLKASHLPFDTLTRLGDHTCNKNVSLNPENTNQSSAKAIIGCCFWGHRGMKRMTCSAGRKNHELLNPSPLRPIHPHPTMTSLQTPTLAVSDGDGIHESSW